MRIRITIAWGIFFSFVFAVTAGCRAGAVSSVNLAAVTVVDTAQEPAGEAVKFNSTPEPKKVDESAPIQFQPHALRGAKSLAALESRYGKDGLDLILKLNRLDRQHAGAAATIMVPTRKTDLLALAPFPAELDMVSPISKIIIVSRKVQAFGAYESGKLIHWGPTSTGKKASPTPAGLYFTNWRAKETRSTINSAWRLPWYFNLDNMHGVAFHQYDLPGVPASHGCVRLLKEDAQWVFNWAEQWILTSERDSVAAYGTPVLIFGDYSYGAQPPWRRLAEDANAASVTRADVEAAFKKHIATIEARAEARRSLIASTSHVNAVSSQ